jgi:hypothetical protein
MLVFHAVLSDIMILYDKPVENPHKIAICQ